MNDKNKKILSQSLDLECEFSKCFRKLREDRELTQGELAEEIGISRQSVNALEKGKSLPSLEVAFDIANFFETSLDQMLRFSREMEQQFNHIINNRPENIGHRKEKNMHELNSWRPLHEAVSLREAMDRLLEDSVITSDTMPSVKIGNFTPTVDMYEDNKNIITEVHTPGLTEKDINVEVDDKAIYIVGEKKQEQEKKKKNYYYKETNYGKFSRTISFPVKVKSEKAQAEFIDGVLKVTAPKLAIKKLKVLKLKINKNKNQ